VFPGQKPLHPNPSKGIESVASANYFSTIAAKGANARCSWTPEEPKVEGREHQDNANIHGQPFQESVSEEREIYTDYDGCHAYCVKNKSCLSTHPRPRSGSDRPSKNTVSSEGYSKSDSMRFAVPGKWLLDQ
jgi:hypothetical protein